MKLPKKIYLATAALLFIGGGVTATVLLKDDPKQVTFKQTASVDTQKPANTEPTASDTATPAAQQSQKVAQPTQTTPQPAQPAYGEDPSNPGIFVVFDKTAVMIAAGVPEAEQPAADQLLTKMMQWRYKQTAFPESDICYVVPVVKMAVSGDDYRDNPITQLKYCQALVSARFSTWDAALAQYKGSGGF